MKGYLRRMASQCGQLLLRGVREQASAAADVLDIPSTRSTPSSPLPRRSSASGL
ncbi:MAG: hypothetical protein U0Z44_16005 [Kouleothrix sp.]